MLGPLWAGVSPGNTLCSAASATFSCASLSGALVATSLSAILIVYGVVYAVVGVIGVEDTGVNSPRCLDLLRMQGLASLGRACPLRGWHVIN